jgi:hypothetical protein
MSATKPSLQKGDNAREHYTLFASVNPIPLSTKYLVDKLYL